MNKLKAPMDRKTFRFQEDDLNNLAHLAKVSGVTESEKLRDLIRIAAGIQHAFPVSPMRKRKRPQISKAMESLDPDTRLILVRACNLLNQAVKALHVSRHLGRPADLLIVGLQLATIEQLLVKVGRKQVEISSKSKEASPC